MVCLTWLWCASSQLRKERNSYWIMESRMIMNIYPLTFRTNPKVLIFIHKTTLCEVLKNTPKAEAQKLDQ
eukprot:jgi/Bigna1/59797/fgenesh1_kg.6_\